ncbi:MAG: hypothetical protein AAF497_29840, partial [Planctomycetota bacterium]
MSKSNRKKPSTKRRRWLIALLVVVLLSAGGAMAFLLQAPESPKDVVDIDQVVDTASEQFHEEKYREGLATLDEHLAALSDHAEGLEVYGRLRLQVPETDNSHVFVAAKALQKSVALDATRIEVIQKLREIYSRSDDAVLELKFARMAYEIAQDATSRNHLATAEVNNGNLQEALDLFRESWEETPSDPKLCAQCMELAYATTQEESQVDAVIESAQQRGAEPLFLEIIKSQVLGDKETERILLTSLGEKFAGGTIEETAWVVEQLDRAGLNRDSLSIIQKLPAVDRTDRAQLDLAYRYLQSNDSEQALQSLDSIKDSTSSQDEITALR